MANSKSKQRRVRMQRKIKARIQTKKKKAAVKALLAKKG
jgi:hypothetical protein